MGITVSEKLPISFVYREPHNTYGLPYAYGNGTAGRFNLRPGVFYPGTDTQLMVNGSFTLTRYAGERFYSMGTFDTGILNKVTGSVHTLSVSLEDGGEVLYPFVYHKHYNGSPYSWSPKRYAVRDANLPFEGWADDWKEVPDVISSIRSSEAAFDRGTPVDIFGSELYPGFSSEMMSGAVVIPAGTDVCAELYRYPAVGDIVRVYGAGDEVCHRVQPNFEVRSRINGERDVYVVNADNEYTVIGGTYFVTSDNSTTVARDTHQALSLYAVPRDKQSFNTYTNTDYSTTTLALDAWRNDRYMQIAESIPTITATFVCTDTFAPVLLPGGRIRNFSYATQGAMSVCVTRDGGYGVSGSLDTEGWDRGTFGSETDKSINSTSQESSWDTGWYSGNPLNVLNLVDPYTLHLQGYATYTALGAGYICPDNVSAVTDLERLPELPHDYLSTIVSKRSVNGELVSHYTSKIVLMHASDAFPDTLVYSYPGYLAVCPPLSPEKYYAEDGRELGAVYASHLPLYSFSRPAERLAVNTITIRDDKTNTSASFLSSYNLQHVMYSDWWGDSPWGMSMYSAHQLYGRAPIGSEVTYKLYALKSEPLGLGVVSHTNASNRLEYSSALDDYVDYSYAAELYTVAGTTNEDLGYTSDNGSHMYTAVSGDLRRYATSVYESYSDAKARSYEELRVYGDAYDNHEVHTMQSHRHIRQSKDNYHRESYYTRYVSNVTVDQTRGASTYYDYFYETVMAETVSAGIVTQTISVQSNKTEYIPEIEIYEDNHTEGWTEHITETFHPNPGGDGGGEWETLAYYSSDFDDSNSAVRTWHTYRSEETRTLVDTNYTEIRYFPVPKVVLPDQITITVDNPPPPSVDMGDRSASYEEILRDAYNDWNAVAASNCVSSTFRGYYAAGVGEYTYSSSSWSYAGLTLDGKYLSHKLTT